MMRSFGTRLYQASAYRDQEQRHSCSEVQDRHQRYRGRCKLNEAINGLSPILLLLPHDADHPLSAGADTLTISGHMKESAGNEYQGLSIDGIGITVVATGHC